ncbi:hypothetical protein ACOME3_008646 [Neoechinorhynchus agilis]
MMEGFDPTIGPNAAVLACIRYVNCNPEWINEMFLGDDDLYVLFDMPGQMELYTHAESTLEFCHLLENLSFKLCSVFLIDSIFISDASRFLGCSLAALTAMMNVQLPSICVITKLDLLSSERREQIERIVTDPLDERWNTVDVPAHSQHFFETLAQILQSNPHVHHRIFDRDDYECISELLTDIDIMIDRVNIDDVKMDDIDADFDD